MKLPATVEYGCKAMVELALQYHTKAPVQVRSIASKQKIPRKFLVQILMRLKNAGLIISVRGNAGGYLLARHPSLMNVAQVIAALDEDLLTNEHEGVASSDPKGHDALWRLWRDVSDDVTGRLKKTAIEVLATQYAGSSLTYSI